MILSDKQILRRCVKQVVRHTATVDIATFNPFDDDLGIKPMLKSFPGGSQLGQPGAMTPISEGAAAMYAAFEALGISLSNLEEAENQQQSYSREAWLREILDVMPARLVLIEVPMNAQRNPTDMDNRLHPLLRVEQEQVQTGRYGINLETEADRIFETCVRFGTRQIMLHGYREDFLSHCLLPLAEDRNCVLHVSIESAKDAERLMRLIRKFPSVHCVLYPEREAEAPLIRSAQGLARILVAVRTPENVELALSHLGFSFVPLAGFSALPEQMLGHWILRREQLLTILSDQYAQLARNGYELTSEAVEADIIHLLAGNFLTFCGIEEDSLPNP